MKKRLAAWLMRPRKIEKSIYEQIAETIAERKKVLPEWEKLFQDKNDSPDRDIHVQLKETILAFRKAMKQHEAFFMGDQNKKAA